MTFETCEGWERDNGDIVSIRYEIESEQDDPRGCLVYVVAVADSEHRPVRLTAAELQRFEDGIAEEWAFGEDCSDDWKGEEDR